MKRILEQIKLFGGVPVCPVIPFDDAFNVDVLSEAISNKTKAIVLSTPHNPLGSILDDDGWRKIAELIRDRPIWLVVDEIYEYLVYDNRSFKSSLELLEDLRDRIFIVNALSKSFSMTGWRIGYGVGPQALIKNIKSLIGHSTTCIPSFLDDGACVALEHGRVLVENEVKALEANRDLCCRILEDLPSTVCWNKPAGGLVVMLDIREWLKENAPEKTAVTICEEILEMLNVSVIPGEACGVDGGIRLSFSVEPESLECGVRQFVRYFQ